MTTLAFSRTFKMAALVLASATLLACDDSLTGIDEDQPSVNMTMIDQDQDQDQDSGNATGTTEDEDDLNR